MHRSYDLIVNDAAQEDDGRVEPAKWALPGWLKDVLVPILVAVVAFAGTGLGAYFANQGSRETQSMQLQEDRSKEDRANRANAYMEMLTEAFNYGGVLSDGISRCTADNPNSEDIRSRCVYSVFRENIHQGRKMFSLFLEVQIYGTDTASAAAYQLYQTFPTELSKNFDIDLFSERLTKFLGVACRELPNNPRPGCP
jgi:hypothetical protein